MSHRTKDLPPVTGIAHTVRELRYHEAARQLLAAVLVLVYALSSEPIVALAIAGVGMAFLGMLVRLYASGFVLKNEELAVNGPYALVRHPLYTGNILLVSGFAIASGHWWAVPLAIFFFWFYYPPAIEYEDRKLDRYFGEDWRDWSYVTPALVPSFRNAAGLFSGRWSLKRSLKNNGEFYIAAYLLMMMGVVIWRIP
jgi:protein-S-isoprenylcysteine O-methyltransferase Ste14